MMNAGLGVRQVTRDIIRAQGSSFGKVNDVQDPGTGKP